MYNCKFQGMSRLCNWFDCMDQQYNQRPNFFSICEFTLPQFELQGKFDSLLSSKKAAAFEDFTSAISQCLRDETKLAFCYVSQKSKELKQKNSSSKYFNKYPLTF